MTYIHHLNNDLDTNLVGAKATGLSQLNKKGVSVPHGIALDKSLLNFYRENNHLPTSFKEELSSVLSSFSSVQLIVRSSAIGEDSEEHSFAGQLDSFVSSNNLDEVIEKIHLCWDGLNNDRVKAYQKMTGHILTEMGVVIQEFIEADYAGVTFTVSPTSSEEIYTEYVKGAGEQLVSGAVTPQNFSVNKNQPISTDLDLPFEAKSLITTIELLKGFFGCELDIEWVSKDDKIYFVQARPITVKQVSKVHWTNTNLNENYPDPISPLLYSIARDSYYHYFKNLGGLLGINHETIRSLEYDFSNTVGIWGNRIYYNMTSIHNILSSSPLKNYFKTAFNQFVGYEDKDVMNRDTSKQSSLFKLVFRFIGLNFGLEKNVSTIESLVSSYSEKVDAATEVSQYKNLFYEFLDLRFHQWYRASLADFFSMIHYKLLGKITQEVYGEQSVGVHNQLIQAIPDLMSSEPLNETWDIAQEIKKHKLLHSYFLSKSASFVYDELISNPDYKIVNDQINDYLKKWGFRCSGELMFFKDNYIDNPVKFIELLQSYLSNTATNPREVIAKKAKEREQAMKSFRKKIWKKHFVFFPLAIWKVLRLNLIASLCKTAIASRERVRYKQAEMYYKFKVVVKKIAYDLCANGSLENQQDLFYLSYKEIGELVSSSGMFQPDLNSLIQNRKVTFETESNKEFPEHFATNFGEQPAEVKESITLDPNALEFSGLAASGGQIQTKVKILDSVLESEKLEKGDILVTKQTDPGWAMVFPIIGGLIVERGGALSHGAIVAREFGIPAVVGVSNITQLLQDDDEVILDGDLGKIQLVKD